MVRRFLKIAIAIYFLCQAGLGLPEILAYDDGFGLSKEVKSRYFTIYIRDGVDTDRLAMRLTVPASVRAIIRSSKEGVSTDSLGGQLDTLYLAICEILEARLKRYQSTVKVCKDAACLTDVALRLFGREIRSGGFYVADLDSLYIDSENVTLYMLGHEMAHAVLTKYFVVPPPARIQEVLAGYVEYELRKYTQTLPAGR